MKKIKIRKSSKAGKQIVICLVHMPPYGVKMPPLGIPYLTSKLRQNGHEVFAFDFNIDYYYSYPEKKHFLDFNNSFLWADKKPFLSNRLLEKETIEKWTKMILEKKPDIIGFTVTDHSFLGANAMSDLIKNECPNALIVYGGPFCSKQSLELRETTDSVDAYVFGEGEATLSEIADSVKKGKGITLAKGIIFKKEGKIIDSEPREPLNIDSLPLPDFSVLPMDKYTRKDVMSILMSRGCNFCCAFCSDHVYLGHHRMRSPESIIAEIEQDIALYGVHEFNCNDLMLNGNIAKLEALADKIIKKELNIRWYGQFRIRPDMRPELFRKLKKAGLQTITIGMESASQPVLDSMRKNFRIKDAEKFIANSHNAGITTMTMWMLGFPSEGWADFFKTIVFIIKNKTNISGVSNLSKCNMHLESELFINRDKYGIRFDNCGNWYNRHINIKTRERREKIFRKIVPHFVPFREN
jgi:radical SAM superfamily enzyme YgiQ (UPF0313 family)